MLTARDELRLLAERLPESVIEELAAIGRLLEQQTRCGDIEDVTDPEEIAIVREALLDGGSGVEFTLQQAKEELVARRPVRQA
jgi:hypothetical protein